eukprot:scaffold1730_cov68-Phaeocystis_antarctica.AAC.1
MRGARAGWTEAGRTRAPATLTAATLATATLTAAALTAATFMWRQLLRLHLLGPRLPQAELVAQPEGAHLVVAVHELRGKAHLVTHLRGPPPRRYGSSADFSSAYYGSAYHGHTYYGSNYHGHTSYATYYGPCAGRRAPTYYGCTNYGYLLWTLRW